MTATQFTESLSNRTKNTIKIAIAGNPNAGKSTIFNNLTGAHQHVGNYPGVTVEKKEGHRKYKERIFNFIDLPGTYSLTSRSQEELIARNYIVNEKPDVVIDVVDASHIERNLYLTLLLKELGAPIIVALNMTDIAESNGHFVDDKKLSELLGIPIIKTAANKKLGMDVLLDTCVDYVDHKINFEERKINYGEEIEEELKIIADLIPEKDKIKNKYTKRWLSVKLLEHDCVPKDPACSIVDANEELQNQVKKSSEKLKKIFNEDPEILLIDRRYGIISGAHTEADKYTPLKKHDYSDSLDIVLTHQVFGLPIFLGIMWLLFTATFKFGAPLVKLIERGFDYLNLAATILLPAGLTQSIVSDGIISGVGGVVSFLPNIIILYALISILEDTGYMARAAFVMDNLMHKIGLHGKSFIPLLIGFGCSVPAIMSTRILESRKERITTMLIIPFMSCSAKLPVYTLLIGAFFSASIGGNVLFTVYLIGILMAVIASKIFTKFLFKGETTHFVMELPPYNIPTFRGILIHMWRRSFMYLKKAGTIILAISLIMWFLSNFPSGSKNPKERLENSFTGTIGKTISPVMKPIGLGDWKVTVSTISGFAAKEVVVSTLGTLYSLEGANEKSTTLRSALKQDKDFNPLKAFVMMIFILISCPCLATFAVVKQETHGWKWPVFLALYTTVLAYTISFMIYQSGTLLSIGV